MDISKVSADKALVTPNQIQNKAAPPESEGARRVTSNVLVAASVKTSADAVVVSIKPGNSDSTKTEEITRTSRLASAVNLASEATDSLKNIVQELGGVVEQAKLAPNAPVELEQKAKQLLDALNSKIGDGSLPSRSDFPDDETRVELERQLGRTLDFIYPADTQNGFGIGDISFASKEAILNTVSKVRTARERIESLGDAVTGVKSDLSRKLKVQEVARQNVEASGASVRDLEEATLLADSTGELISRNPTLALNSFGKLYTRSAEVLK